MTRHTSAACYSCQQPAVDREHVPPRCLFPEQKDTHGIDYRKQLLTVPSCRAHNTDKSGEDEFLLLVLASYFENNAVGNEHTLAKVKRAVNRMPSKFRQMITGEVVPVSGGGKALPIDRGRFDREIELIVKALYFAHHGIVLARPVTIATTALRCHAESQLDLGLDDLREVEAVQGFLGPNSPFRGENPGVFQYRFRCEPKPFALGVEMLFYEAFRVVGWVVESPITAFNL